MKTSSDMNPNLLEDADSFVQSATSFDVGISPIQNKSKGNPFPLEFYNSKLPASNVSPLYNDSSLQILESIRPVGKSPGIKAKLKESFQSPVQKLHDFRDNLPQGGVIGLPPASLKKSRSLHPLGPRKRKKSANDMRYGKTVIIRSEMVHPSRNDSLTPEKYLFGKIFAERGYDTTLTKTLNQSRFTAPNDERILSYTTELVSAVRTGDLETMNILKSKGLNMAACNKFGESILHIAARRGEIKTFAFLMNAVDSVYITDDQGRTILHDACWSATPNFNVVKMILDVDSSLLRATDVRGSTPLAYIKREHWQRW
eukprot:CAMPEP_0117797218 /NCGR_PEP_ID=MMETSP0948-20121206/12396_1 /TAXON_ID=44440 /ORGANISM="Chattonella subsalsa, Strain CCMP2191" /LENGTH=313 /DNA_ID=CAMNT_0005628569 /DNA_START=195 /DNA_END=1133 /DNA_ORIENTATION=+